VKIKQRKTTRRHHWKGYGWNATV